MLEKNDLFKISDFKLSGNKPELLTRVYYHLKLSNKAVKIQAQFRKYIVKRIMAHNNILKYKINNCTNETDFFSLQKITEIPFHQLILYKDNNDFIYVINR